MRPELNDPPPSWQQLVITIAVVVGILAGVAAIISSVVLLQRTCAVYDLTGEEARCKWSGRL
ncbi:MAG: hypothetical protein J0I99_00675 [Devosia sp.]|uniref:hypothetical protein n=1 Tax=Devosia sp. TaxID=1871048 RepID=UPI001ACB336D|nr:hypothetical protein [Devosia sp.]MBN9314231.1 hypothetical protein [Devosia sp.]